jgi:hypothetical protein
MSENTVTVTMDREAANALYACLMVELHNEFVAASYLAKLQPAMDALHKAMGYKTDDD